MSHNPAPKWHPSDQHIISKYGLKKNLITTHEMVKDCLFTSYRIK